VTIDVAIAIELTESSLERLQGVSAEVRLMPLRDGARSDAAVVLGGDRSRVQRWTCSRRSRSTPRASFG
jgi:hypothetical protein